VLLFGNTRRDSVERDLIAKYERDNDAGRLSDARRVLEKMQNDLDWQLRPSFQSTWLPPPMPTARATTNNATRGACKGLRKRSRPKGKGETPRDMSQIQTIEDLISQIRNDSSSWHPKEPRWFRGEPDAKTALIPTLYRDNFGPHENALLQMFRARATGFHDAVPMREHTDQWLFLARHAGLPTRLLDWSEGALIALHFALKEDNPVVWMLNPLDLNDLSYTVRPTSRPRDFPLPWHDPKGKTKSPAFENLRGAWEQNGHGVPLPVAIYPTYVHTRLRGQRSCFTIHGTDKSGLDSLLAGKPILKRYMVAPACRQSMRTDLAMLGITESVVLPDIDGLAKELKEGYS
jgi:hypothetical protein